MGVEIPNPIPLLVTVGVTTVVWVSVTLLTAPADHATLVRFYELTRPAGPGWNAIRAESKIGASPDSLPQMMLGWTSGITFIYAALFGTGSIIYGKTLQASIWAVAFLVSGFVLMRVVSRIWSADDSVDVGSETSALAAARPCTKAVILAAGRGKRMRAENDGPELSPEQAAAAESGVKGMIPVGRPFLDYVLSALADAGFTDVCIVVAPDQTAMREYYSNTVLKRLRITFAVQLEPIGTADAVLAAQEFTFGEPFVVLNSDNYYPPQPLARLRATDGPATIGFSAEGLLRGGNIPLERLDAFAYLEVDSDGLLRKIREKPSDVPAVPPGPEILVSMNCWRLTSAFFRACRDVQTSPRGELELPLAVQYAIDVLGLRIKVIPDESSVLDLSARADIPRVALALSTAEVSL
jgi:dTDP-glucose pyrophosphorylase